MKLDCVLTAVNNKPLYYSFIPYFIKSWKKLYPTIDVKIIFINNIIPDDIKQYEENIILFKPLPNISTAFISQYIRILYPAILGYENGVMITDIDMIPMSSTFYTENIKKYDNNKFIVLRDVLQKYKEYPICYCVANSKVWSYITSINLIDDVKNILIIVFKNNKHIEGHGKTGWNLDQKHLYQLINKFNEKSKNLVLLKDKDTGFTRFDRTNFKNLNENIKNNIKNEKYTDYHCKRPFDKYEEINNKILECLPQK